ncbi:sugar phosphate nucleotidyltransferase [Rubellimicrobium arenae]|uniref:sugar phosphate nucleotidyltransferase n=1 Tax=Rubellimicrobium arenae TaxID=2817372 RepID=UPI001B303507|nr:sugar phosphate nucleotidyltransferase [Rubellimicrobium arenae]
MDRTNIFDPSRTLAVLLAGGPGSRLHELSALEAKGALPLAGGRLADVAIAAAKSAGVGRVLALVRHRPETLLRYFPMRWGEEIDISVHDGRRFGGGRGTVEALASAVDAIDAADPHQILILPADQVQALDLRAMMDAHAQGGAPATLASRHDLPGPVLIDWSALRPHLAAVPEAASEDLWADLLPRIAADGDLATWVPPSRTYWRDVDTLDDLREVFLDVQRGVSCLLPPGEAGPLADDGRDLAFEAGGISLSAPRFGARTPGRWTLLEDTVVLPGARIAAGARLTRAVVAPGAIIPAGLVVGEDPEDDARWFRVTPGGTTLLTPPMLAARAAERMRARLQSRTPGLATSGR